MKRVLRLATTLQYPFTRHEIISKLNTGERNVFQLTATSDPRYSGRPLMLAGILGMLGFNRDISEEDPITSTVKSAILSIQVDRRERFKCKNLPILKGRKEILSKLIDFFMLLFSKPRFRGMWTLWPIFTAWWQTWPWRGGCSPRLRSSLLLC